MNLRAIGASFVSIVVSLALVASIVACAGVASGDESTPGPNALDLSSSATTLATGTSTTLQADSHTLSADDVIWHATGGALSVNGLAAEYTAPEVPGSYVVTVSARENPDMAATVVLDVPGGLVDAFTMVVMPDTQNMIRSSSLSPLVAGMTQWIVDRTDVLPIAFVTQVGDLVYHASDTAQWDRAEAAMGVLDGVVPYSVALGDHEYLVEEDKGSSTAAYRTRFGSARYAAYEWYGGSAPNGLSHVQIFEAGGRSFLHIALEWEAPGPASDPTTPLGWARTVIEAHPGLPTIISTHGYVWDQPGDEGRFPDTAREGYAWIDGVKVFVGSSGETIFQELVYPHPQVFMVVNGHYHLSPVGDPDNGEFHQVSLNAAGQPVYEMLSNYQDWPSGGDGWLRLVEFLPAGGTDGLDAISVKTYSPTLDAYQTEARSSFTFELSFAERFDTAP